ncbi:MAG: L-serine ammonia-lyase, iron-sulfur-dependent subunit beta [Oscillospiraceae bacterium]
MKEQSVFDIIGPNMIGPSSSHTAGALKISLLAGKLVKGKIIAVKFILYGSFAATYKGHGTDRALVGGILGFATDDPRIKESFSYAQKAGIEFSFEPNTEIKGLHPNTVDVIINTDKKDEGTTIVRGESIGGGAAVIRQLNGVDIKLSGEYSTLLVRQKDTPGVLAHITLAFAKENVNIAFTRMYREEKGTIAYTIIEADGDIPQAVIADIEQSTSIYSTVLIQI